jgi:DNA-binding NtrC family response regulator
LVDDDPKLLISVSASLSKATSYPVSAAASAAEALAMIPAAAFSLIISDVKMPQMDGLALLREVGRLRQAPPVVMLTAYGSIELAVECLKCGAYDFLTKPVEMDRLLALVRNALGKAKHSEEEGLCGLLGKSRAMRAVFSQIRSYAATDSTVLVTGESGTGKELAAKAIHALSARRQRKLVVVNCPAIPEPVLESELFGHARGAFTSAVADRKGLLEEADGGTVVLDEIGDLPLRLQAKLLRVLEDKEVRPLGSNRSRRVDLRCLALTNQDLAAKVGAGEFRLDLYHRLNVLRLHLPPLRERPEDIRELAVHFHAEIGRQAGKTGLRLSPETLDLLAGQPWPGNVRELRNVIERGLVLGSLCLPATEFPFPQEAAPSLRPAAFFGGKVVPYQRAKQELLEDFSRAYFVSVMEASQGNVTVAARQCGLKRQYLQWALQRYGLRQAGQ